MTSTLRSLIASAVLVGALSLGGLVQAAEKLPETAAEHEAAASEYQRKAKEHRAEAGMHKNMAQMYQARIKGPASTKPNPWLINMVKHCNEMSKKADALAKAEEQAAEVHAAQAKGAPSASAASTK